LAAHAHTLSAAGVDALNLPWREWTPPLVADAHAAGVLAFAWGVSQSADLDRLLRAGVDALYSDYPDRLVRALGQKK
jgi:glycerophosphoryl diester phosphodiesterase